MADDVTPESPFLVDDEALKGLLDTFKKFLDDMSGEEFKGRIGWQRDRSEQIQKTLLNKDYLESSSKKTTIEDIKKYSRTLDGPAAINIGDRRLSGDYAKLKRNLLFLIEAEDDILSAAVRILEGDYQVKFFSNAFWTPLFQMRFPKDLPNWNKKTELLLGNLGVDITPRGLDLRTKYGRIAEAFKYLQRLDERYDFIMLDNLMHFGVTEGEGGKYVESMSGAESTEPPVGSGKFAGFTKEAFELFGQVARDSSLRAVKPLRDRIYEKALNPLRNLMLDIAPHFDKEDALALEKQKRILGNLWKQNNTAAYPHGWCAYYQKGSGRPKSMQMFATLSSDLFSYGVSTPMKNDDIRRRVAENLRKHSEDILEFLPEDFFQRFKFYQYYEGNEPYTYYNVGGIEELADRYEHSNLAVGVVLTVDEAIRKGGNLVSEIRETFEELVPVYVMGISENPMSILDNYYGYEKGFTKEQLLELLFIDKDELEQILGVLDERNTQQIIFQGPPGTGKTFIATKLAHYLAGSEGRVATIQFHPSYSYEDFIEGFRPVEGGDFDLVRGVFRSFCKNARDNLQDKYVMVIDEINRGNVSKIFGELLYLLEYRNEHVQLTYSREGFSIPENLYIIGTMNTADRSLALMDYALRRRFWFFSLNCNTGRLRDWLKGNNCLLNVDALIGTIETLNASIETEMKSKEFAVGHSYFMRKGLNAVTLKRIIDFQVRPLLEEYFFDKQERVQELLGEFDRFQKK